MKKLIRNIKNNPVTNSWNNHEYDKLATAQDSVLFEKISEYMKGRLDLEDVKNDSDLHKIEEDIKNLIWDYHKNNSEKKDNEKFIRDIFKNRAAEESLIDEINQIKNENGKSDVNMVTAEWVKKRARIVRYLCLPVAAILGIFMLLRTLLPSSDPEKLFKSYYEPFNIVSSVTRNMSVIEPEGYSSGIEQYKLGEYQTAASGFSIALLKDTSQISPRFFMGITQIGLGNYDEAVKLLKGIAYRSGEYSKEARWYLGLVYLKTGDTEKAAECFEYLAKSSGFYSARSERILRRLK